MDTIVIACGFPMFEKQSPQGDDTVPVLGQILTT